MMKLKFNPFAPNLVREPKRLFFKSLRMDESPEDYDGAVTDAPYIVAEDEANLVGSITDTAGWHMPVLDIDVPAKLVPSSTPGHHHLYIDVPMTWEQYKRMLYALRDAGILEHGYVAASLAKSGTFVRKPGVLKPGATPVGSINGSCGYNDELGG